MKRLVIPNLELVLSLIINLQQQKIVQKIIFFVLHLKKTLFYELSENILG